MFSNSCIKNKTWWIVQHATLYVFFSFLKAINQHTNQYVNQLKNRYDLVFCGAVVAAINWRKFNFQAENWREVLAVFDTWIQIYVSHECNVRQMRESNRFSIWAAHFLLHYANVRHRSYLKIYRFRGSDEVIRSIIH